MHPAIVKLALSTKFPAEARLALEKALAANVAVVRAGQEVVHQEDAVLEVSFVISGMLARTKVLPDGRRQIVGLLLPGDSCDVGVSLLGPRSHSLVALTDTALSRVLDATLSDHASRYSEIRAALLLDSLIETAIAREWIVNVGQRSACERAAHLFCELYYRLRAVGLAQGLSYELPLTQASLADILGLSAVHVNRTLQELRHLKLIAFGDARLTILDLERLKDLAMFEATYLHQLMTADGKGVEKPQDQIRSRRIRPDEKAGTRPVLG